MTHKKPNGGWLELPAQVMLLAVLTVAPWLYGGVHEVVQYWLLLGISVPLGWYMLAGLLRFRRCRPLPLAIWPLLLALLWGVLQLIPLPRAIVAAVSPQAVQLRDELLPGGDSPDAALDRELDLLDGDNRQTISLRPQATRQDLALLVLAVAAFYLGSQLFRRPRGQFWLFLIMAGNGTALAFFGLIQKLMWNGQLYWVGAVPGGGHPFAAFVNRNNAGGYLNLCVATAIGLTIWTLARREAAGEKRDRGEAFAKRVRRFLSQLDARRLAAFCLVIVLLGGVLSTLSRGAGIAVLGAGVITALAMSLNPVRRRQVGWFAVAALAGLALVGWVGMYEGLQTRMATLAEQEELVEEGRVPNWKDAARAIPEFWQTGVGLGGYRDAYLMYQHRIAPSWYYHAENQYLESLVDAGAIGLLLLLVMIGLVAFACWRLLRSGGGAAAEAIAIVTVFALSTQAIHGLFDFGLYLPANMMLLAVLCGAVTGVAADTRIGENITSRFLSRSVTWLVGLLLLAVVLLAAREKRAFAITAAALADTDFGSRLNSATEDEVREGIERLTLLAESYPDDAELQYQLAKLHILLYRLTELSRLRNETAAIVSLDTLWKQTSSAALHLRAHQLARAGKLAELSRWRETPVIQSHLIPALQHLLLARRAAPLLSKYHLRIAWLSVLADAPEHDEIHLARACRVNPSSTYTLSEAGLLDMQAGRREAACRHWQQCLTYAPKNVDDVLADAELWLDFNSIVSEVLPQSPAFLLDLAERPLRSAADEERRKILIVQTEHLIEASDLPEADRAALRGRLFAISGDVTRAIREYLAAVQQQPNNAIWRAALAQLLLTKGLANDARKQMEACIRLKPDNPSYREQLERIMLELHR